MESLKLLRFNMLIDKMQKINKQNLKSPLPKSLHGTLRIPPDFCKSASAVFEISLFYQQTCWWVLPPNDPSFNAQALSLHKGWSIVSLALQHTL